MRADVRHGRQVDASTLTVADYYAQWFARMRRDWSGSRITTVAMVWERYARDYFGAMPLQKVSRHDVQRLIDTMTDAGLQGSTIKTYMVGITAMLDAAVEDGIIPRSPAQRLTYPRVEDAERVTWSPLQMRRFLHATRDDATYGPLWALLIATGCRIGEALALEWDDVNLDAGTVSLHARIARQPDGSYARQRGTKTDRRGRTAAIEPWMVERLRAHQERQNGPRVFHDAGEPLRHGRVLYRWYRVVADAGLPVMRIHDVRHSVATAMVAAGVSDRIVQEILGHASLRTTMETYTHVAVRTQRQGTGAMAEMLGFGPSGSENVVAERGGASKVRQSTGTK